MDDITQRPIYDLKEAPQNSRKHTEDQIDQIAASIEKFGWTIPVLIDDAGTIIAGHARVRAAKKLGMAEAPCIVATGWDDNKKEAYQIADNRLAEMSTWDEAILSDQIKRLNAANFDLGFLDMSDFDASLFKPTLDPKVQVGEVSGGAVDKAKANQDAKFQPNEGQTYEIMCPHCGEEFDVKI